MSRIKKRLEVRCGYLWCCSDLAVCGGIRRCCWNGGVCVCVRDEKERKTERRLAGGGGGGWVVAVGASANGGWWWWMDGWKSPKGEGRCRSTPDERVSGQAREKARSGERRWWLLARMERGLQYYFTFVLARHGESWGWCYCDGDIRG